jgi:hypothetical protein
MGWVRKTGIAAMLACTGAAVPAIAGEPLVVTKLADAETHLLALDGSPITPSPEQRNLDFIAALTAASLTREQEIDAQCRKVASIPPNGEARMSWEAKCRYRRR